LNNIVSSKSRESGLGFADSDEERDNNNNSAVKAFEQVSEHQ